MKILGVLLQSKKGDPLIISSAPSLHTRSIILYSNMIYDIILENYRRRQKIQRCIVLEYNLQCVLTITKDYIFYVFVNKSELGLAFDGIRKVTQYFNNNSLKIFQGAKNGQAKLQVVNKKSVQFMSVFEQFLYTRQLALREYLPLQPQNESKKKDIDFQIFNKFSHISQDTDKKIILEMVKSSNKIAALQVDKKLKVIQNMKKFSVKNQDELDLLETDPQKQKFLINYKRNLVKFAHCGRTKNLSLIPQKKQYEKTVDSTNNIIIEQLIQQQPVIEKQKIKIKLMQKLQLHLFQGKIKEVIQFGQIVVEGTEPQTAIVNLLNSQQSWSNPKILNKRITPNSLQITQVNQSSYKFTTLSDYKSKPIIDYIIRKQTFTQQKIPLLFVYTTEVNSSNIQFVFKYKINEKWKEPLHDIEITVCLNPQFIVNGDCKTIPMAVSLRNSKIVWKTKQISHTSSSKGKILLAFTKSNISPYQIIKQIRLTMKCPNKGVIDGMMAECLQQDGQRNKAEKVLLISYKVQPNQ